MVTTSPRPRHPRAYTILESLIVLAILAILSWVVFALFMHDKKPEASADGSPPPRSADTSADPADAPPPAGGDTPKE